jgi:Zn-dependent peptidase ImmA (M78 family)
MPYRRGDYRDKWRIERTAAATRSRLGLDQLVVLDPNLIVEDLGATVFHLSDLLGDDGVGLRRARKIGFDGVSTTHPETGDPLIILNCGRSVRRRMATLMEELAHLLLKHKPCTITQDPQLGVMQRTFDGAQEDEAYDLGAALLLPKERIQRDVKEMEFSAGEIADQHNCSEQLVEYRIRRMMLWPRYAGYRERAS